MFQIDKTLDEHGYKLENKLGRGGYASVYRVKSEKYACDFVVKVQKHKGDVPIDKENEIRALISLNHPNILCMYEYFADDHYLYLILEYCSGGSLADLVRNHGPLRGEQLTYVCRKVTEGLIACHEAHIAHRDIKPANILIDQYGRPKLSDFGLSDVYEQGSLLKSRAGSLAFLAPEVLRRSEGHDPFKADIWALGVTFYYIATGHLPWKTENTLAMQDSIQMGIISFDYGVITKKFIELLKGMVQIDTRLRMTLTQVLDSPALRLDNQDFPAFSLPRKQIWAQPRTSSLLSSQQGQGQELGGQRACVRAALSSDNMHMVGNPKFKGLFLNAPLTGSSAGFFSKRRNSPFVCTFT